MDITIIIIVILIVLLMGGGGWYWWGPRAAGTPGPGPAFNPASIVWILLIIILLVWLLRELHLVRF